MTYADEQRFEDLAEKIRQRTGCGDTLYVDAKTFFFKAKKCLGFSYYWPDDNSTPEYDATKNRISIPLSVVGKAERRGGERDRMTIFHECCHPFLGHQDVKYRAQSGNLAEKYSYKVRRDEQDAKRLAAAIMAPLRLIDPAWTVDEIAMKFGLSRQAADIRKAQHNEYIRRQTGAPRPLQKNFDDLLAMLNGNEKKNR